MRLCVQVLRPTIHAHTHHAESQRAMNMSLCPLNSASMGGQVLEAGHFLPDAAKLPSRLTEGVKSVLSRNPGILHYLPSDWSERDDV